MTQEALKLALEAFHQIFNTTPVYHNDGTCIINDKSVELSNKAIAAIKEALAQTQEPVAWAHYDTFKNLDFLTTARFKATLATKNTGACCIALYTTPPQRTWVGLEGEEIRNLWEEATKPDRSTMTMVTSFARAIESKLKEVNT